MHRFAALMIALTLPLVLTMPLTAGEDTAPPSGKAEPDAEAASDEKPESDASPTGREKLRRLVELQRAVARAFDAEAYEKARVALEEMVELAPGHAPAWYNLACANSRLGKVDEALRCLKKAVTRGYGDAEHMEADPDLEAVRQAEGYAQILKQVEDQPETVRVPTGRGEGEKNARYRKIQRKLHKLFEKGKYAECEPLLKELLEIEPQSATAHYNLACVYAQTERPAKAVERLLTAVERGWANFRHMERDPDLEPLRDRGDYRALLDRRDEIQRKRAESIEAKLRERFGDGYLYEIDHANKLVFATDTDRRSLDELKRVLTEYAEAQWRDLFTHGFDQYATVVIPRKTRMGSVGGYYSGASHTLVAKTVGMTLLHEFTHALHYADQAGHGQDHPIWITEGLATLFESQEMRGGRAVPVDNRRLAVVKHCAKRDRLVPWKKLFEFDHPKFMKRAPICYPEARYVMMYLHRQGKLKVWYDAYVEGYEEDKTGASAVETVFGKPLDEVEADWVAWVEKLENVPTNIPVEHAYFGIQVAPAVDGVKVARVVEGSGADAAGLEPGDVIFKVDGRRTIDTDQLLRLVSGREVGERVKVHFRRDEEYRTAEVTLGPKPDPNRPASETKPDTPPEKADTAPERRKAA